MVTTMISLKIYLRRVAGPSSEFPLLPVCTHQYIMWQVERDGEKYLRGHWKRPWDVEPREQKSSYLHHTAKTNTPDVFFVSKKSVSPTSFSPSLYTTIVSRL